MKIQDITSEHLLDSKTTRDSVDLPQRILSEIIAKIDFKSVAIFVVAITLA